MKAKNITYSEFKRRVFNEVILESMCRLHCQVLNGACGLKEAECNPDEARYTEMARKMCTAFYKNELNLDTATVGQTKKRLSETNEFLKDVANTAEDIAEDKAEAAREEKLEIPEDQKVELSTEDKAVLKWIRFVMPLWRLWLPKTRRPKRSAKRSTLPSLRLPLAMQLRSTWRRR